MKGPVARKTTKANVTEQEGERSQGLARPLGQSGLRADILSLQQAAGNRSISSFMESNSNAATPVEPFPGYVNRVIQTPGERLISAVRRSLEVGLGNDFSDVQVHTGAQATESAEKLGARAFTVGDHVVFGHREYQPNSSDGRSLLAHELTHVVQQRQGLRVTESQLEHDADRALAPSVSTTGIATRRQPTARPRLQLKPDAITKIIANEEKQTLTFILDTGNPIIAELALDFSSESFTASAFWDKRKRGIGITISTSGQKILDFTYSKKDEKRLFRLLNRITPQNPVDFKFIAARDPLAELFPLLTGETEEQAERRKSEQKESATRTTQRAAGTAEQATGPEDAPIGSVPVFGESEEGSTRGVRGGTREKTTLSGNIKGSRKGSEEGRRGGGETGPPAGFTKEEGGIEGGSLNPEPGGAEGGAKGGEIGGIKEGARGAIGLFPLIRIPVSIRPLVEVAIIASDAGLADGIFSKLMKKLLPKVFIKKTIRKEAKRHAKRELRKLRKQLKKTNAELDEELSEVFSIQKQIQIFEGQQHRAAQEIKRLRKDLQELRKAKTEGSPITSETIDHFEVQLETAIRIEEAASELQNEAVEAAKKLRLKDLPENVPTKGEVSDFKAAELKTGELGTATAPSEGVIPRPPGKEVPVEVRRSGRSGKQPRQPESPRRPKEQSQRKSTSSEIEEVPNVDEPFIIERLTGEVGDVPIPKPPRGFQRSPQRPTQRRKVSRNVVTRRRRERKRFRELEKEEIIPTSAPPSGRPRTRKVTPEAQQFDVPLPVKEGRPLKIREMTPTPKIQKRAQQQLPPGSRDPAFPNRVLGANEIAQADHIVSVDLIRTRPGFSRLTRENQAKVLNRPDNFVAMSPTANQSKGGKSFREWEKHETLGPVDKNFRNEMIRRERDLLPKIDEQIDDLLRQQLSKGKQLGND